METNNEENEVRLLYFRLLKNWNDNNPSDFAGLFTTNGNVIGFDGSQMNGRMQINEELSKIFANHTVASYVGIVKEVRTIAPDAYILRAVAGMISPGQTKIKPEVNAIQSLVAQKKDGKFLITLYQNTPAAFHRRPELNEQLTRELQQAFDNSDNGLDSSVTYTADDPQQKL